MTNRLDFITNKKGCKLKKGKIIPKTRKHLLKELEKAHFKVAKLEFENLELKKEKDKLRSDFDEDTL